MVEEWDDKGCEERKFDEGMERSEEGHALHVKLNEPVNKLNEQANKLN